VRPFLKWLGGKYRLLNEIQKVLPQGCCLVEPFVGSGAVFLNSNFNNYILADLNKDLIYMYTAVQQNYPNFLAASKKLFAAKYNNAAQYYKLREKFNASEASIERAAIFLYLNRHGYNGLCRYNSSGLFNVPFGRYDKPYYPAKELEHFHFKSQTAKFYCQDFITSMANLPENAVVYCDPPYVPISDTATFTEYFAGKFLLKQQEKLALMACELANQGVPVLISNHNTAFVRKLYKGAKLKKLQVSRFINCVATKRQPVMELLALFNTTSQLRK